MRVVSGMIVGLVITTGSVQADMLGARVGVDYWQVQPEVSAGDPGKAGQLVLNDANELAWYGRFEHPLPLLPNIAVRYQRSEVSANAALVNPIVLEQKTFATGIVATQYNSLKNTDITGYYEVLDNPVFSMDLGLTARLLQSDVRLTAPSTAAARDLSVVLPMLFVDAEIGLWGTGTHWFFSGNYSQYQSDLNYDWRSGIAWRFIDIAMFQAHLRAGWQRAQTNVSNRDQLDFTVANDGSFIGIDIDF
ncbi:MAG: TIGR04219 family outer membrane beta-barrel protein [Rheinheimera sp.]|nr:TIGR04219 family outer membrane beta-barrel protein [Rheinheimera sp.]